MGESHNPHGPGSLSGHAEAVGRELALPPL